MLPRFLFRQRMKLYTLNVKGGKTTKSVKYGAIRYRHKSSDAREIKLLYTSPEHNERVTIARHDRYNPANSIGVPFYFNISH